MIINAENLSNSTYGHVVRQVVLSLRNIDRKEIACAMPDVGLSVEEYLISDSCQAQKGAWVCVDENDKPVAIGGIYTIQPKVGNAWLLATDDFKNHKIELSRFVRRNIERWLSECGHRIQCVTAAFHSNSIEWLKFSGFQPEAELKKYGANGETFYQFSITR